MKISYNWLKSIMDFNWSVEELAEKLTMSGSEVEAIEKYGGDLDGVIIGEVRKAKKHPAADKLTLCKVYDGSETVSVICGAPNVAEGQKVLLAKIGTKLPNGMKIKKAKLRGVESFGMICSYAELNLGEDASGIAVLPEDTRTGTSARELFGSEDFVLELEITPNRPDCLSHRGIAREVQALGGGILPPPKLDLKESGSDIAAEVSIDITNPDDCPRYAARVIKGVNIKPSPLWLVARLQSVGIRSINNVVDVTNYVMMEYGHPLHAFDFNLFDEKKVVVRGAEESEIFITLDGVKRALPKGSVLITDGQKPVALGGIMGGENSEVTDLTIDILLEAAYFDPVRIRKTSKALKLSTESSQRFERGADCENLTIALNRAAQLINELAGGEISKGIADCYPRKFEKVKIDLKAEDVNKLLGTSFNTRQISDILRGLDIEVEKMNMDSLSLGIPSFRPDLTRPVDLIEEIARIYGYDNIPSRDTLSGSMEVITPKSFRISDLMREYFVGCGFNEVVNWVLDDPKEYDKLDYKYEPVVISNPLSEDTAILRPNLMGTLLTNISYNLNRGIADIGIFEIDKVFSSLGKGKLPDERLMFGLGWVGEAQKPNWGNTKRKVDIFDIKGIAEDFFRYYNIGNMSFEPIKNPYLDETLNLGIFLNKFEIGWLGKTSEKVALKYNIKIPVWVIMLDAYMLADKVSLNGHFKEPPKFPHSDRDLAVVIEDKVLVGELIEFVKNLKIDFLEDVRLFDIYVGKQVPKGKKSVALSIRFRHQDKTLTDEEVDKAMNYILVQLKGKYPLDLRM